MVIVKVMEKYTFTSVFRIEVPEPYPRTNGGQNIRRTRGPARSNCYIFVNLNLKKYVEFKNYKF